MRSEYGKLTDPRKTKSGSKARPVTARKKWIVANFGCLADHIDRRSNTITSAKVSLYNIYLYIFKYSCVILMIKSSVNIHLWSNIT